MKAKIAYPANPYCSAWFRICEENQIQ